MPFYAEYAIIRRLPPRVQYVNGAIQFEIVQVPWLATTKWEFRARKVQAEEATCVITASLYSKTHLSEQLAGGFVLEESTPAARIMERLVRDGYATKRTARREH